MVIGAWGGIVFQVREEQTAMLSGLQETSSSIIAKHDIISDKSKYQWIGYNAEELSLKIVFDSTVCKKPYQKYMQLKELEGKASPMIIGNKRIGYRSWLLQKIDGDFTRIISKGAISRIEVNCKFVEYYTGESNAEF